MTRIVTTTPFRILSLNVAQLPFPLGIKNRNARAKNLVDKILAIDQEQPDVICLQELFRHRGRKYVIKALEDIYRFVFADNRRGRHLLGVNSGLAILSRFPIIDKMIHRYTKYRGVENFAKKSILGVMLEINDDEYVCVFTTHLQTGLGGEPCICKLFETNSDTSNELKTMQIQEAATAIQDFRRSTHPVYFVGDFNIPANKPLYLITSAILLARCNIVDVFDHNESELDTSVIGREDRRIDHLFASSPESSQNVISSHFGTYGDVTDHYAVSGFVN